MADDAVIHEDTGLEEVLEQNKQILARAASKTDTPQWLASCASSVPGTEKLLDLLDRHISRPAFLRELRKKSEQDAVKADGVIDDKITRETEVPEDSQASEDPTKPALEHDWWELRPSGEFASLSEETGEYIVIEHADAIAAISHCIAAYLMAFPQAAQCDPVELQKALSQTIKEMKKGRIRLLVDWTRTVYRAVAVSYGAFSAYTNPWLAKAVLTAIIAAVRALGGIIFV